jgi:hypothetical protein
MIDGTMERMGKVANQLYYSPTVTAKCYAGLSTTNSTHSAMFTNKTLYSMFPKIPVHLKQM